MDSPTELFVSHRTFHFVALPLALAVAQPALAQDVPQSPAPPAVAPAETVVLTVPQMFELAEAARQRGDFEAAEKVYRALIENPDSEVRTEARFRLGMMLADDLHKYPAAAVEFRKILDEKPHAGRVRLELARMEAMMGHPGAAARELRAAEAGGLPPDVSRVVRFYASALDDMKPIGYSFGLSLAPDTNVNRATRSDTLGTVIGDFTLDQDAKAQSGIGLQLRGQAYARVGLGGRTRLLMQVSSQGLFYRKPQFNDAAINLQAGPELRSGNDRFNFSGQVGWRWYGARPYSQTYGVAGSWTHPAGKKAQLKLGAAIGRDDNRLNNLQDATTYSTSVEYDRSFTARTGAGLSLYGSRIAARDPGYSQKSVGGGLVLYREAGPATLVLSTGYGHLEADERLILYPRRRIDNRYSVGLGATLRIFDLGVFAPMVQVRFERNKSTIELYDYSRFSGEIGVTAAF